MALYYISNNQLLRLQVSQYIVYGKNEGNSLQKPSLSKITYHETSTLYRGN